MAYLQDNQYFTAQRKKRSTFKYVIVFIVFALIVVLCRSLFHKFAYTVMVPVVDGGLAVERGLYGITHSKAELTERINFLESENAELRTKMLDYNLLQNENSGLKNSVISKSTGKIAAVVGKPSRSEYDTLLTVSGENAEVGEKVYSISGVPLGTVTTALNNNSTVTLYSSPGREVEADIILSDAMDSVSVTMRGRGGGSYEAIVPKDINVPVGSLATMPSLFSEPMAEVVKTVARDDTKDQVVYLRSIVNFQYLRFVVFVK